MTNKTKAALFALLLFGLGIAVGALGHRYFTAPAVNAKVSEDFRHKYMSEMEAKLKLNQHQVDQLQVILDETRVKFDALHVSHHPEIEKIKNEQITKVKSILSADQSKQYEALIAEHEQHAKEQDDRDRQEDQRQAAAHLKALSGH